MPASRRSPAGPRPTLKTIAAATGLAVATVSRALTDAPDIGAATKARVREAARTLGYRPNRAGVRLRTGKTNVIALVLSTETDMMTHTSRLIYAIAAALRGTAYHLVVMPYFPDQDTMEPVRYLAETGSADGVILNQTLPDDPRVRYLVAQGLPFVTHGRTDMGLEHPYFDFDNHAFARLAVAALWDRGRRHLLLIAPPLDQSYAYELIAGFTAEADRHGIRAEIAQGISSDSPAAEVEAAVTARMGQGAPDGLITASPNAAMAAISGAEAAGLRIGSDFDIVAKEAIPFLRRFRKETMVVQEDVGRAGDFLARAVMTAIEQTQAGQGQYLGQYLDCPTGLDAGDGQQKSQ